MGGDLAVEDVNLAAGKQRAQMVVGAAIAQAELQYRAGHVLDQARGRIEAFALRHHPPNEAIEPAHAADGRRPSAIRLGQRVAQLVRRAVEARCQFAHNLNRHFGKLGDQAKK